jgi:autotransporter translocation and assembly factor TamB
MRKNRLLLIGLAIIVVAVGTVLLAPFTVSNGLHFWLRWQAHRQHLKIDHGYISAPLLRPIAIDHLHITSESGSATQVDIHTEQIILHPRLVSIVTGRADGIRAMSIKAARAEIRRDYSGNARSTAFNWPVLQKLLPGNFEVSHLDLRVENGPTVVLLLNASVSASQIESGRFTAGEYTIVSPLIRQKFSQLRGATKWRDNRLTIGGMNLSRGLDLQSMTIDLSHLDHERADLQFDLDVFGGKIRGSVSNEWAGKHSTWNLAGTANDISLARTSEALGFTDQLGGSLRACSFTFRGDPRDPMSGTASVWTELNGLSWRNRAADVIMLGAVFYNREIQLQQLYIKQRQNELTMSGEGAIPSKSADWLNPDFRGQILGKINDLGQLAELFGAAPKTFAGAIAIEGILNAGQRKLGGFLIASGTSLSLFKRQIDKFNAKISLKTDALELEQFEVVRKKDFLRAQGKVDIAHANDYSGTIEAKVADAAEYLPLERAGAKAAIPLQLNAQIASSSWDAHGGFTLAGSSPVEFNGKFPLKIGQDWKTFLATPLEMTVQFPAVVLASAPQFFHPAIFTEGILSGTISIAQNLQHPSINGDLQLLNGVLQNAPLDLNRASARITFNGEHGALEFLNGATKDVDLSLKGDLDFRNSNDVSLKISSALPVFDTTTSVQDCVRAIEIQSIDVTLAPTVQEVELRGDLFGNTWKLNLNELGTSAAAAMVIPLTREFHFCASPIPPGEIFTFGVHPRPQPTPAKSKKRAKSR